MSHARAVLLQPAVLGCWLLCLLVAAAGPTAAHSASAGSSVAGLYSSFVSSRLMRRLLQAKAPAVPAAVAAAPAAKTAAVQPAAAAKPAAAAAGAANATGLPSAAPRNWRPGFPFPQCLQTTLSYDVSFVGNVKYVQVGTVKYAYHRFGPMRPAVQRQQQQAGGGQQAGSSSIFALGSFNASKPNSPVVFLSGWGMQMYMWPVPLLTRLAEDREVVIFDSMRTGLTTDSSNAKLSIPMMANSTAALIDQLGLSKPDIWSWSVGGFVAYALLAFNPGKIGNVIITAGSPGGPEARLTSLSVVQDLVDMGSNYTALLPYLFPQGAADQGVCQFYAALNSFFSSPNTQLLSPLGKKSLEEQAWAVFDFFNDPTVANKLSNDATPNPVLILHGVQDRMVHIRNAGLGASKLLSSWMLQFPGQGHGIPFEFVRAIISTTLEFFSYASPLSAADMAQWASAGGPASMFTPQQLSAAIAAESALAGKR